MARLTVNRIERLEEIVATQSGDRHSTVFGIVRVDGSLKYCLERVDGKWVETDRPHDMLLAEKLERALVSTKRFVVIVGGRGSGKSVGVIDISLAGIMDNADKVFYLREYQESIAESVHSLNKYEIERFKLEGFRSTDSAIYHKGGGEGKYRGLARNPDSIKSAAGFRRFVIEEAATLSKVSIQALTPTARNQPKAGLPTEIVEHEEDALKNVQIIFVANPRSSEDEFSKRFINPFLSEIRKNGYYEDELHLIIRMNYTDNPWFAQSGLETERQFDYENKSRAEYDWIWEGEFMDDIDNSIIKAEWFDACIDAHVKLGFDASGQEKIAYDPADTGDAKAIAYQCGSVVCDVRNSTAGLVDEATEWALSLTNKAKPDVFLWDADGIGLGLRRQISDSLGNKKILAVPFHGGAGVDDPNEEILDDTFEGNVKQTNKDAYTNLRAQCYFRLAERMRKTYLAVEKKKYTSPDELISFSSTIEELPQLRAELCRIPRVYVGSGKFQIMSKKDMKSKLKLSSPNMADSVMMLQKTVDMYRLDQYEEYDYSHTSNDGWL